MPTVTRLTSNGVFQSSGGFDEISLDSGSIFFDGTADFLNAPAGNQYNFGTGDFTVECWFYLTANAALNGGGVRPANLFSNAQQIEIIHFSFAVDGDATTTGTGLSIYKNQNTEVGISALATINKFNWYHAAVTKSGTSVRFFLNGTQIGTTATDSTFWGSSGRQSWVARLISNNASYFHDFPGYISNLRVVKGSAVYTSNFTPPTAPLLPISNTSLLLTASPQNPYLDSSVNNSTITRSGTPRFNSLGPFYYPGNTSINLANTNNNPVLGSNTNIITSTTSNGVVMVTGEFDEVNMSSQSLYFSGSPNYLSVDKTNIGNLTGNPFTIEAWIYLTAYPTFTNGYYSEIFATTNTSSANGGNFGFQFALAGTVSSYTGALLYANNGSLFYTASYSFLLRTWYHITLTRTAAGVFTIYVDGNSIGTTTNATGWTDNSPYAIGRNNQSTYEYYFPGNISNFRLNIGTPLYSANFIPPQMVLSPVSNTKVLLNNFAAEPFVDNSGNNNIITVNGGVTANTLTPFTNTQRKILNTGTMMVKEYDEITGSSVVDSSLQLWLDAGQPASYPGSGTTWTDLSGNSRNGTLTGGPTYSATNDGSIVFDGTDDFVQCSGSLTVTAATFVAWIRRNGTQNPYSGIIFSRGPSGIDVSGLAIGQTGTFNEIGYTWNALSSTYFFTSNLTIPDLTWCMIAVSVTSTAATLYLCQSSGITTATNTTSHPSTLLGDIKIAQDEIGGRFFKGNIAAAMIYNRALTATEIGQNFNALRGRYGI
jgi:hypothetical protein